MVLLLALVLFVGTTITIAVYRAGPGRRRALLSETALLGAGFVVYFVVRKVTEGSEEQALANAQRIIEFQTWLGVFVEPALNEFAASRQWLLNAANWVYIWGHWPVIAFAAAWLYRARPDGYRLTRNAFLISGSIGFLFFALVPTAPPRLLETNVAEFVDTVSEFSNSYRFLQPPEVTNQYAAMPSLHFGWNLLIGVAVARYATKPTVRVLGALSPIAMFAATVLTANHYLLDIVVGGAVALTGLMIAAYIIRKQGPTPVPVREPPPRLRPYPAEAPGSRHHVSVRGSPPRPIYGPLPPVSMPIDVR